MADGVVGAARVKLHQALHGYAEGHRELACSAKLKPRDAKTMLVLSDVSGAGGRIDEAGYVTGYPLADAGLYAFAKTWAAPEMPRPGCVWTHTLLLDFADLARLGSLADLIQAFRRPQPNDHPSYDKTLQLDCAGESAHLSPADEGWAKRVLAVLYGRPKAPIIASRDPSSATDLVVTALWSQQWPRLRRSFRFCTLASSDRSTEGAPFDLQLLPTGNQALRTRFPSAVDAETVSSSADWLDEAIDDLLNPKPEGLRHFLRQIGGDVGGGRAAFAPLCRLHRLIETFGSEPAAIVDAITLLQDDLGAAQARAARAMVAGAAVTQAERLDENGLDYMLTHIELIDPVILQKAGASFGRTVLRRRPHAFVAMAGQDDTIGDLVAQTIAAAEPAELIEAFAATPALAKLALAQRPNLAAEPALWAPELAVDHPAFAVLKAARWDQGRIIAAIMSAKRTDLAGRTVAEAGALEVLTALAAMLRAGERPHVAEHWARAAAQPNAVAQLFMRHDRQPRQLLALLSRSVGPDDIPNDYGADPWLTAVNHADGALPEQEETYLRAFLLARSLGWRSQSQAELAQLGFESTYRAAGLGSLTEESWRWLDSRLPWSMLWFEWDRCQRLRAGVASLFVERGLSPEIFGGVVRDGSLFGTLMDQTARTARGRAYLKQVRRALKETADGTSSSRRDFIEKLIK